jgi:hypothetical protein
MAHMQKHSIEPVLASRRAAALALGVSIRTVDVLIARQTLQTRRIGRRRLVVVSSIHAFALKGSRRAKGTQ